MGPESVAQVTIYVDSQAALITLGSCFAKSSIEEGCQRSIKELINYCKLRLCWIPDRETVRYEVAGKLARQGLVIYIISVETCINPLR